MNMSIAEINLIISELDCNSSSDDNTVFNKLGRG